MIAVDTNILVYSVREDSPWHREALKCLRDLAEGPTAWAIPWPCIHEFLTVVTNPRIYRPPMDMAQAIRQVDYWMESPGLRLLAEEPWYWDHLKLLLIAGKIQGPMVHDARIAAICRASGVRELWSADRDFMRFPGLLVKNPLAS